MKAITQLLCLTTLSFTTSAVLLPAAEPTQDKAIRDNEALVQIAILLDTSSSMDGLIEQPIGCSERSVSWIQKR